MVQSTGDSNPNPGKTRGYPYQMGLWLALQGLGLGSVVWLGFRSVGLVLA